MGSLITTIGVLITQSSETRRIEFTAAQTRRSEALNFLDAFSKTCGQRSYAASDYFSALRTGKDKETIALKEKALMDSRKEMIIFTPMIIARGHDYFGEEFKDLFYKEFIELFTQLEMRLENFQEKQDSETTAEILKLQETIELEHGMLLGIANRQLHTSKYELPR